MGVNTCLENFISDIPMIESKYIVYFRSGKFRVCSESGRYMLEDKEIIVENIDSFDLADKIAAEMNWKLVTKTI